MIIEKMDLEEFENELVKCPQLIKDLRSNGDLGDEDGEIKIYPEKTKITDVKESCIGYGVLIYEGRIDKDKVLFTAEDVY